MRNLLEIELGELWVEGEISNLRRQASGHCYFTLKDDGAQVSCVLFRGNARYAKVQPDNGLKVKVFGEVSVYEARGQLQMIIKKVEPLGAGDLQARFEALKQKLNAEGLFDASHKKPLPKFAQKIGLITSPSGAALQDMLNVLSRRAPWVQPILYPVQVQGAGAERGIARAIHQWSNPEKFNLPEVDLIIVGRGGGSLEDLWNFNEEIVARCMHACPTPIISAVGHEIDFTIADFVADHRAPTPSAAAEIAVPNGADLRHKVEVLRQAMRRSVANKLRHHDTQLASIRRTAIPKNPERLLSQAIQKVDNSRDQLKSAAHKHLDHLTARLEKIQLRHEHVHPEKVMLRRAEKLDQLDRSLKNALDHQLDNKAKKLNQLAGMLRTLGPESVLSRGYSITLDAAGKVVTKESDVSSGDVLTTKLHQGELSSTVNDK